jgi:Plastocyanin
MISCGKTTIILETPRTNEVLIKSMEFNPDTITVSVNTTVTWINQDAVPHTVTSNDGLFDSGSIISSSEGGNIQGTYGYRFTTPGIYPYYCSYHTSMTGIVVVK